MFEKTIRRLGSLAINRLLIVTLLSICVQDLVFGQVVAERVYLPNLANEDWSFLEDPAKRSDFWDPLKYISLGKEDRFLTLGGEFRINPQGFRIRSTDDNSGSRDSYLLQRYLLSADLHLSRRFRVFTELQSGLINGNFTSPRPIDENSLDLHQLFIEWKGTPAAGHTLGVKLGRQELQIGSSRLISASPSLNVKRSFDGANFFYRGESWRMDAGFARLVSLERGAFDDRWDTNQKFWGIAANRKSPRFDEGRLGFYYLGVDQKRAVYAQGTGRDLRHTAGISWTGSGTRFDLDYDVILQWGSFSDAPVRAWAVSTETGYFWGLAGQDSRLSIRFNSASGDRDARDPKLQSFNPLFPGASYAGIIGLLGPTNLTDLTPAFSFVPITNILIVLEWPNYWRTSTEDGIYGTDLRLLIPPSAGTGRFVGSNPGLVVSWKSTVHLTIEGVVTRFHSGDFLKTTVLADGVFFYSLAARYRF